MFQIFVILISLSSILTMIFGVLYLKYRVSNKKSSPIKFGKLVLVNIDGMEIFLYRRLNEDDSFSFYDMNYDFIDQKKFKISNLRETNDGGSFFVPTGKKRTQSFYKSFSDLKNESFADTSPSNFHLDTKPSLSSKDLDYEINVPSTDTQPVPTLK